MIFRTTATKTNTLVKSIKMYHLLNNTKSSSVQRNRCKWNAEKCNFKSCRKMITWKIMIRHNKNDSGTIWIRMPLSFENFKKLRHIDTAIKVNNLYFCQLYSTIYTVLPIYSTAQLQFYFHTCVHVRCFSVICACENN